MDGYTVFIAIITGELLVLYSIVILNVVAAVETKKAK